MNDKSLMLSAKSGGVKEEAINRALVLLKALKAEYRIVLPSGETFGELSMDLTKKGTIRKRAHRKYPSGSMQTYAKPFYTNAKVGDVIVIPSGEFDPEVLRSTVTASLSLKWGKGAYISHVKNGSIEIFRTA